MCDGRSFAPLPHRFFAAWRVEAPFSRGFLFRWVLHVVLSLSRSVIVYDATSCSMENSLFECGRPKNDLSCLFFTALLLHRSQSMLVQENQPVKDIQSDLLQGVPNQGHRMLTGGAHQDLINPDLPFSLEDPNDEPHVPDNMPH